MKDIEFDRCIVCLVQSRCTCSQLVIYVEEVELESGIPEKAD